ncbi:hypothetical protein JCM11641_001921 [Rhodosporidiobolus odoratus]
MIETVSVGLAPLQSLENVKASGFVGTQPPPSAIPIERDTRGHVQRALKLPVPTTFPAFKNPQFQQLFSSKPAEPPLEEDFRSIYHPERLEFCGDRLLEDIVVQTLFFLAPVQRLQSQKGPYLGVLHTETSRLVSNTMNAKLADEFKLPPVPAKPGAVWEAYLQALLLANGRPAVVDFLVPLIKREFFIARPELLPLYATAEKGPWSCSAQTVCTSLSPATSSTEKAGSPEAGRKLGSSAKEKLESLRFASRKDAERNLLDTLEKAKITFSFRSTPDNCVLRLPGYPAIVTHGKDGTMAGLVRMCVSQKVIRIGGPSPVPVPQQSVKPKRSSKKATPLLAPAASLTKGEQQMDL